MKNYEDNKSIQRLHTEHANYLEALRKVNDELAELEKKKDKLMDKKVTCQKDLDNVKNILEKCGALERI